MNTLFCGKTKHPITHCDEHMHKSWEIILNTGGANTSIIGGTEYNIEGGSVMIIPPEISHGGYSSEVYTDMYVQARKLDFSGVMVINDHDGSIRALMIMLQKVMVQHETNYAAIVDSILDTMCQFVKKYSEKEYKYKFVYDIKDIIYKNISNPNFRIFHVSKAVGYNVDYIRRCFCLEIGKTPHEYLTGLRLGQAKKLLLQETFVSIENVASLCGFSDSFYFSTYFKKKYGVSPSEYRKKKL